MKKAVTKRKYYVILHQQFDRWNRIYDRIKHEVYFKRRRNSCEKYLHPGITPELQI